MFQAIVRLCAGLGQNTYNNNKKIYPTQISQQFSRAFENN